MGNTFTWTTSSGDWSAASNWSDLTSATPGPPTASDEADFSGGGGTVLGTGTALIANFSGFAPWTLAGVNLTLSGQPTGFLPVAANFSAPVTLQGGVLTASAGGVDVSGSAPTLTVQGGATVSVLDTQVGSFVGQTGTLVVSGPGTTWHDAANAAVTTATGFTTGFMLLGGGGNGPLNATGSLQVTDFAALTEDTSSAVGSSPGSAAVAEVSQSATWSIGTSLTVGQSGTGTLNVNTGGVVSSGGFDQIGANPGATGTVTLDGTGSAWKSNGQIAIGGGGAGQVNVGNAASLSAGGGLGLSLGAAAGGSGVLAITGGGQVTDNGIVTAIGATAGATGTVRIIGAGSTLGGKAGVAIGDNGTGTLAVSNGGTLKAGGQFNIGFFAGSVGYLTVDNATATATGFVAVGTSPGSAGHATISDSGTMTSVSADFGENAGAAGDATVTTSGIWHIATAITVGDSGQGAVSITAGGTLATGGNFDQLGRVAGASGRLTVDGGTSLFSSGAKGLLIGGAGAGSVTVTNGGSVAASAPVGLAGNPGGSGSLTVNAGRFTDANALVIGAAGSAAVSVLNGGTLTTGGGVDQLGSLAGASGSLTVDGALSLFSSGASAFNLGGAGVGAVTVSNHASLAVSGQFALGALAGGSGTLLVNAAQVSAANALEVGSLGFGSVTITAGGTFIANGGLDALGAFAGASGNLTVDGAGSLFDSGVQNVAIGSAGLALGTATLSHGGSLHAGGVVGVGTDGIGTAIIASGGSLNAAGGFDVGTFADGAGAVTVAAANVSTAGALTVGDAGSGSLSIIAGGTLTTASGFDQLGRLAGATASLTIDGAGALFSSQGQGLTIGTSGAGVVTVANGASLEAAGLLGLGSTASGVGTVLVNAGQLIASSLLTVGGAGTGSLTITNGGVVSASLLQAGAQAGASGVVGLDGAGSQLSVAGDLTLGDLGTGSLSVVTGGTVIADQVEAGHQAGGSGAVALAGAGSRLGVTGTLTIGDAGTGSLSINTGGTITAARVQSGVQAGSSGLMDLEGAGSRLDIAGTLRIGEAGSAVMVVGAGSELTVGGTIHIGAHGVLDPQGGLIDPPVIENDGQITGAGVLEGDVTNSGTVIAQGGAIQVTGSVGGTGTLVVGSGSELQLNGSVGAGQTVQFNSTGTSTGVLTLNHLSAFTPGMITGFSTGDTIAIASTSTLTQSFNDGTLALSDNTGTVAALVFGGTHTAGDFTDAIITAAVNSSSIGGPSPLTGNMINDGTIFAANGTLDVQGQILGSGTLAVDTHGVLRLDNVIGSGQAVRFADGTGTLDIGNIGGFAATIGSFNVGDEIIIPGSSIASDIFDTKTHTLTLFDASDGTIGTIAFSPSAAGVAFAIDGIGIVGAIPVVSGAGNSVDYTAGGTAVVVDPGLKISDAASTLLAGATVSITSGGFVDDGDVLNADTTGTAVIANYDTTTEVLSLTGSDTLIDYKHVLDSVTFGSSSLDPTKGGSQTSRTISWVVNDGLASSAAVTSTVIVLPCFVAGTRIATERGDVAVEELHEGDHVRVVFGGGLREVIWIGHRQVDCAHHPEPRKVWPVRIAAGAFGPSRPCRDLWVSPDHAVYVDGVLIPVKHLINGTSIAQIPRSIVGYYHVELRRHDVVLAEGLPVESYLDVGDRSNFANGGGAMRLFPDFATRIWEAEGCAPLVITGVKLKAVRRRLNARARGAARAAAATAA